MNRPDDLSRRDADPDRGFRLLALLTGAVVALLLVVSPQVAFDRWGVADPAAAALLLWSMSAGFAVGVGWQPRRAILRLPLSAGACLLALVLAVLRVASH